MIPPQDELRDTRVNTTIPPRRVEFEAATNFCHGVMQTSTRRKGWRIVLVAAYWLVLFLVVFVFEAVTVGGVVGLGLAALLALLMLVLTWKSL